MYLGFEIKGANKKNSPVSLIDHFLYTVSYKPILSAGASLGFQPNQGKNTKF